MPGSEDSLKRGLEARQSWAARHLLPEIPHACGIFHTHTVH